MGKLDNNKNNNENKGMTCNYFRKKNLGIKYVLRNVPPPSGVDRGASSPLSPPPGSSRGGGQGKYKIKRKLRLKSQHLTMSKTKDLSKFNVNIWGFNISQQLPKYA